MSRTLAWIIAAVAIGLIYSLAFTTYDLEVGVESTESGGFTREYVECPPPYRVLVFDARPEGDGEADENRCLLSSRSLAIEAGVVALAGGLLAWKPLTRARPKRIQPISEKLNQSED